MEILVFILVIIILGLIVFAQVEYKNRKFYQHKFETLKGINNYFDVGDFNHWFVNNKNKDFNAHGGIFLRLDKLSSSHIIAYLYENRNPHNLSYEEINQLSFISFSHQFYMEKIIRDNWHELNESDKDFQEILNEYLDN